MKPYEEFHHSLTVDTDLCVGCAHCIRHCPTKALRIRGGKASLRKDWCVDCGECLRACPVGAIFVRQDDFDRIFGFDCRAVLFPAALLGQFADSYTEREILAALHALGFTHAFPVEMSVPVIRERMAAQIAANRRKPLISPLCPAVIRLIQTKFPDLTEHVMNLRTPVEATAMLVRRRLLAAKYAPERIGLFYVTPCAAKAATGKEDRDGTPLVDGILNLDSLYNRLCRILSGKKACALADSEEVLPQAARADLGWTLPGGEAAAFAGRCLAVDGIGEVKEFLEHAETTGVLHEVDFLELRACSRGCLGGSLTAANRFVSEERLRRRLEEHPAQAGPDLPDDGERRFIADRMEVGGIPPMTKLLFRGDIQQVLRSMDEAQRIRRSLPGLDCGACGSPTCESLSHDIVRGEAQPSDCIFLHIATDLAEGGSDAMDQLERVWGRERFRREPQR